MVLVKRLCMVTMAELCWVTQTSEAVRVLQLLVMATDFRDSNSQMESSVSIMNYSGTVT